MTIREDVQRYYLKAAKLKAEKNPNISKVPIFERDGDRVKFYTPIIDIPNFRFKNEDLEFNMDGQGIGDGTRKKVGNENGQENAFTPNPEEHAYQEFEARNAIEYMKQMLELPDLRSSKGGHKTQRSTRNSMSRSNGILNRRRTLKSALERSIGSGTHKINDPKITILDPDKRKRYAIANEKDEPDVVVVYALDCSGSMVNTLDFVKEAAWWIDGLIGTAYPRAKRHYMHYEAVPYETNKDQFFEISAGGENNMGLSLALANEIFKGYANSDKYLVQLTDGDHADLEIERRSVDSYRQFQAADHRARKMTIDLGNPLVNLILPEVNAVFVVEAGAEYQENYSEYLEELDAKDAKNKLKIASVKSDAIFERGTDLILEVLEKLFKQ